MTRHSAIAHRSRSLGTIIAAITLAAICHKSSIALASASNTASASKPVSKFPFGGWLSPSRADPQTEAWNDVTRGTPSIEIVKRGGGLTKQKRKGAVPKGIVGSTPGGKKMVKKLKKKRALKTATSIKSKLNKPIKIDDSMNKMPTIFHEDEQKYDRYAAALAVTEGLRRVRDAEVERIQKSNKKNKTKEAIKSAEGEFLLQSTKAVKALGLTVAQFNDIGREVLGENTLKERVSEQAYLYRMASTINLERIPLLHDPASKKLLTSPKHKRHRVQMFARSITEIEDLRSDEMEALRQSLQVERFPPGFDLTDPLVQPLLHPEVQAVCQKFPAKAEEIVKRYGLESDEFNRMLDETKGNPIFRWRVQKYVEKAEEERRNGKNS